MTSHLVQFCYTVNGFEVKKKKKKETSHLVSVHAISHPSHLEMHRKKKTGITGSCVQAFPAILLKIDVRFHASWLKQSPLSFLLWIKQQMPALTPSSSRANLLILHSPGEIDNEDDGQQR